MVVRETELAWAVDMFTPCSDGRCCDNCAAVIVEDGVVVTIKQPQFTAALCGECAVQLARLICERVGGNATCS